MRRRLPIRPSVRLAGMTALAAAAALVAVPAGASAPSSPGSAASYWTPQRIANAIPRDLVVDQQGRGYLRLPDGTLEPYGNGAAEPAQGKPGGGGGHGGAPDSGPMSFTSRDPASGSTVAASPYTFSADVSDPDGVKSVTFVVTDPSGTTSYAASNAGGSTWSASVPLTDGPGSWYVEGRDGAKKGGNTYISDTLDFTVDTGTAGGGGSTSPVITNSHWTSGGTVHTAAGRLYFEMPYHGALWSGYVCSGTVATDTATGKSIVITAAHCVYDDANGVFARNVLFIPDQDATTASGTNTVCTDDPYGCWLPSHGVVDANWASRTWPDNIPYDYGYYVVPDSGAHQTGYMSGVNDALATAVGSLAVDFTTGPTTGDYTHAFGYSYSDDPNLMYCAQNLGTTNPLSGSSYTSLWLGDCGLSGGASGGPWFDPFTDNTGSGTIVSVNSFGYNNQPGMGGVDLANSAAGCVFATAAGSGASSTTGIKASCP